jgi:hypothetical protein
MTQARRASRFRRPSSSVAPRPSVLLVADAQDVGEFLDGSTRAGLELPVEAVPDVDAAWHRLDRRGVYTGREQTPTLLVVCHPERAGLLPFIRRLRGDGLLRPIPVVLLTPGGLHCPDTESARVAPILYFQRPETPAARARLARELAALLPEV